MIILTDGDAMHKNKIYVKQENEKTRRFSLGITKGRKKEREDYGKA